MHRPAGRRGARTAADRLEISAEVRALVRVEPEAEKIGEIRPGFGKTVEPPVMEIRGRRESVEQRRRLERLAGARPASGAHVMDLAVEEIVVGPVAGRATARRVVGERTVEYLLAAAGGAGRRGGQAPARPQHGVVGEGEAVLKRHQRLDHQVRGNAAGEFVGDREQRKVLHRLEAPVAPERRAVAGADDAGHVDRVVHIVLDQRDRAVGDIEVAGLVGQALEEHRRAGAAVGMA